MMVPRKRSNGATITVNFQLNNVNVLPQQSIIKGGTLSFTVADFDEIFVTPYQGQFE